MPLTTTAGNQALDSLAGATTPTNIIQYASLHSAYSASGANELTGGSPAYARVALTWSAASSESKALSGSPSAHNVPASSTVAFVGLWSASTAGTFAGMGANGGAPFTAYTAATTGNLFTAPGVSFTANQAVVLWTGVGTTTPGGFTIGTVYYVLSPSGATFTLSATSGGGAVTVASAGSGLIQAITLESFGAQGTFTLTADTIAAV